MHIPFCRSKCPYCDFNSYAGMEQLESKYVAALLEHIRQTRQQIPFKFDTIFIGGGTPTALSEPCLEQLLEGIRQLFPGSGSEFTMEANPKTLTPRKLELMLEKGVNRISIGLQAWQDELLKKIGRIHTAADFLDSVNLARTAGFTNINADVMYQLPGQTLAQWEETLEALLALDLPHLSCYSLTIAEGTPFSRRLPAPLPGEDTEREMNHLAKNKLTKKGIFPYEISNFAKPGYECRHNLIYWKGEEYAAFGAGASGYLQGVRYTWPHNPEEYIQKVYSKVLRPSQTEKVEDKLGEVLMLRLRLTEGINREEMEALYGTGCLLPYEPIIQRHLNNGLLQKTIKGFALTERGFDLANQVMCDFLA